MFLITIKIEDTDSKRVFQPEYVFVRTGINQTTTKFDIPIIDKDGLVFRCFDIITQAFPDDWPKPEILEERT